MAFVKILSAIGGLSKTVTCKWFLGSFLHNPTYMTSLVHTPNHKFREVFLGGVDKNMSSFFFLLVKFWAFQCFFIAQGNARQNHFEKNKQCFYVKFVTYHSSLSFVFRKKTAIFLHLWRFLHVLVQ